jgi:phosphoglycerol transferase MdoB-like AlkP superfamily enzyme
MRFLEKFNLNFSRDFTLKLSLLLLALPLGLFALARATLYFSYPGFFSGLTLTDTLGAFINGLRFDISVTALFVGPFLFFMNVPFKGAWYLKLWASFILFEIISLMVFLAADLVYFASVYRHIGEELLNLKNDWGFLPAYALKENLPAIILLLAVAVVLAWAVFKFINKNYRRHGLKWPYEIFKLLFITAFIVLGTRGRLGGKSLSIADVYGAAKNQAQAVLMLNGAFSAYHICRKSSARITNDFPADKAIENMQLAFISPAETLTDRAYPLMRARKGAQAQDINIVIILLESWTPRYIDALSSSSYGVTPAFDKIAKEGVIFTNAYAVGTRSIAGFSAVLGSVPLLPALPVFGEGLEVTAVPRIFKNFNDRGYYTFFAQTSLRHSFRLCLLSSYLGAKECFGWEDLSPQMDYPEKSYYGFDLDLYAFAADKIKNLKGKKFFTLLFTGITHEPFVKIADRFEIYKGSSWQDGYLNALSYADYSLGRFLQRAREDGWFDNTVFILVADHVARKTGRQNPSEDFNIPLVLYAPAFLKPAVYDYPVSQLDIIPTIYELAGIESPYTAFGRSLFEDAPGRFAFIADGDMTGVITKDGALQMAGGKTTATPHTDGFDAKKAEETLLSFDKAAYTLLKNNKWFKNEK